MNRENNLIMFPNPSDPTENIGSWAQDSIYTAAYDQTGNVLISSLLSHSWDVVGDVHSMDDGAKSVANHTIIESQENVNHAISEWSHSQQQQQQNLQKVVGKK